MKKSYLQSKILFIPEFANFLGQRLLGNIYYFNALCDFLCGNIWEMPKSRPWKVPIFHSTYDNEMFEIHNIAP